MIDAVRRPPDSQSVKSRDVIRRLEQAGFRLVRQKGSHCQFRHPDRPGIVTVPHPDSDLATGTIKSIERQSGIALRQ